MAEDDPFENELCRLYESETETQRALDLLNCGGPSLVDIYLHASGEHDLTTAHRQHVATCRVCQRALDLARRQLPRRPLVRAASHAWGRTVTAVGPIIRFPQLNRRIVVAASMAAAILIVVVLSWRSTPQALAGQDLAAAALGTTRYIPALDLLSRLGQALQQDAPQVEDLVRERDEFRQLALDSPDAQIRAEAAEKTNKLWQQVCWRQRNVGEFETALAECREWITFIKDTPSLGTEAGWYHVSLNDLGDIYAAMGDFAAARQAYADSITARRAHIQRGSSGSPHAAQDRLREAARILPPLYWKLSALAMLERDLTEARRWHAEAESCLRDYYIAFCQANSIGLSEGPTLMEAFEAAPQDLDTSADEDARKARHSGFMPNPDPSMMVVVRACLYHEARLLTVGEKYSAAEAALARARQMEGFPIHDEERLAFALPLEEGRLAIIRSDYAAALDRLAEADANSGEFRARDKAGVEVIRPAIAGVRLIEFMLIRGLALVGLDPNSAEGAQLIEQARSLPEQMASRLPAEHRDAFLKQFSEWARLLAQCVKPETSGAR